jgi:hypothetical protein
MKIKTVRYINSLDDIEVLKLQLKRKLRKQEEIIDNQLEVFRTISTPQNIYNEVLKGFSLQNSLLSFLPLALKYKDVLLDKITGIPTKKINWILVAGAVAGVLGFYVYKRNFGKKKDSTTNSEVI